MHILVLNWQDRTHPQAGGAEVHLHEIFSRIVAKGHSVTLFCCAYEGAPARETIDGIQVIRLGNRSTFNWGVRRWWRREGRHLGADIVVDDINKIPFFTPHYVDIPLVGLIHHFFGDTIFQEAGVLSGHYVSYFERQIGKVYRSTPIIVVSESTRKEAIERGIPAENISIVYNGIDPHSFPMTVGTKEHVPTVTYFGRLKRYKSVHHLIQAFAIVRERIPSARLRILGTGDDRSHLENLVHSLGMNDAVVFHGYVSRDDKVRLLSSSHVVVNTSVKEGWGITNLEANACGTPVVVSDVPGLRDSVRQGDSGLMYPYGDIQALAAAVTHILADEADRQRLSEGAVRWASTFTWSRSAQDMLARLQRVVSSFSH
ncbi:MAG: glycosyltransferase family 4 protein [Candidatus Kapabacteria bacterium]|jgi:glycosyltransferase involved in cell wall biosynthesis|nr:glycosyltransferase family 4 protein [Candidatus Kapabacteria bacterium]